MRPVGVRLTMISPNCAGSMKRPWLSIGSSNAARAGTGNWLRRPDATCTLFWRTASTISFAVRSRAVASSGSIQIRMEYARSAKMLNWPTPFRRARRSTICVRAKFERYVLSREPSGECRCSTISMSGEFFATLTPSRRTSSGSRGSAIATRFCTSTWARSRLVPSSKVTLIVSRPSPVEEDCRNSMPSTPLISCSSGVATVSATVSALAPG